MKLKCYIVILFFFISSISIGQSGYLRSLTSGFDDYPQCALSVANGIVIGGYSKLTTNDWAIYVAKFDLNGTLQWNKRLNGSGKDLLHDIELTSDGGFLLSGRTWSYLTMGGDAFITKLDANGNQLFTTVVDGYQNYYNAGLAADELSNGDFIQIGKHHMFYNPVRYDWEINHYSPTGQHLSSYVIGKVDGDDGAFDIQSINYATNQYVAAGYTEDLTTGEDPSFLYANLNGPIYFASYAGVGDERAIRIIQSLDNFFYLIGYTNSFGAGGNDIFVIKLDGFWNIWWQKTYGGAGEDLIMDATIDDNFGLVIAGSTDGFNSQGTDNLIIRIDKDGNLIKGVSFGGPYDENIESATLDSSSHFIFQSKSNSYTNGTINDIILLKTDSLLIPGCEFNEVPIQVNNASFATVLNATQSTGSINNTSVSLNTSNQTFTDQDLMPIIDAGTDQVVCDSNLIALIAYNPNNFTITWSDGVVEGVPFYPLDSNYYTATANSFGCEYSDSVLVQIEDPLQIGFTADTLYGCAPLTVNFTDLYSQPSATCLWDFGNGNTSLQCGNVSTIYTDTGCFDVTYSLTSPSGCIIDTTLNNMICVHEQPIANFSYSPAFLSFDDTLVSFINNSSGASNYYWNFAGIGNSTLEAPSFTFSGIGIYNITLTATSNYGCTDIISQQIEIGTGSTFFVPNSFTPNGDGTNDLFLPISYGTTIDHYSLKIYNRWGELIFTSKNIGNGWDGSYKGETVLQDMYIWVIELRNSLNEIKKKTGHVFVIR